LLLKSRVRRVNPGCSRLGVDVPGWRDVIISEFPGLTSTITLVWGW